jgi:hypothetical protein
MNPPINLQTHNDRVKTRRYNDVLNLQLTLHHYGLDAFIDVLYEASTRASEETENLGYGISENWHSFAQYVKDFSQKE